MSQRFQCMAGPGGMASNTVFICSEDPVMRDSLARLVISAGLKVEALPSLKDALKAAGQGPAGCLVLDTCAGNPVELTRLAAACARLPVVVLTERGDIPTAVHVIRQGAAYVLQKPCNDENLLDHIKRIMTEKTDGHAIG